MDQEHAAFHEQFLGLFTANEAAIRAYVRRLVPTRDDAADVMQGISLVLWKKFATFDEPDDFRRWAFGVARYETLAWMRDKARDRLVLANDVLEMVAQESTNLEMQLSAQREVLENCLGQLPREQRTLVLEAYMPDACIQEVANLSGRTEAAFYQWLHRMRGRLRECTRRALQAEGML